MKIVVNHRYGGFGLSSEAVMRYAELKGFNQDGNYEEDSYWLDSGVDRADPLLVQVVEELGEKAGDEFAHLDIQEIPDDVNWEIHEYDGFESIQEVHRSW